MPVYKKVSTKTGKVSWYAIFYYKDWTGKRVQKKKEGFSTQREAKAYEHDFLERAAGSSNMSFSALLDIYLENLSTRAKVTTLEHRKTIIENHLRPTLGKLAINAITPATVRKWQESFADKEYSTYYLYTVHRILSTILNFAVKYYGLAKNPARTAGNAWKAKPESEMQFLTLEQFQRLRAILQATGDTPHGVAVTFLFLTGCRVGELLALTAADIDFDAATVNINKTYTRRGKEDIITPPKTEKSKRTVALPAVLVQTLQDYIQALGGVTPQQRIFDCINAESLRKALNGATEKAGLPHCRIDDLRHSHASLLIEQGIPPLAVADRLGHENIQTTLNIYSHLYPGKQKEIADCIQKAITL